MKHDHMIKIGGKYYSAGEEVPDEVELPFHEVDITSEKGQLLFSDDDITLETQPSRRGRPKKSC